MPSLTPRGLPRPAAPRRLPRRAAALLAGAGLLGGAATAQAAPQEPDTLLARGSIGPAVADVQRALHEHANGRFGQSTRRAVIRFQRRHHLLVDGIVGPQTWDALFHIRTLPITPDGTTSGTAGVPSGYSSYSGEYAGAGGYSIPSGIVACESGGDYSAVNPSSGAGGAYQILPSTWRAYGGQGLPQDAPPAEQDQIAAEIYARQGPSAWTC